MYHRKDVFTNTVADAAAFEYYHTFFDDDNDEYIRENDDSDIDIDEPMDEPLDESPD